MDMAGKLLQQLLLGVIILAATAVSIANSTCDRECGNIKIPYPFGTSEGCYLDKPFLITCNHTFDPPKPFLDHDIPVENISVPNGELRVSNPVAHLCREFNKAHQSPCGKPQDPVNFNCISRVDYTRISALLNLSSFRISETRNKITSVGCNVYTYIQGSEGQKGFTTGCLSLCDENLNVVSGSCSGIGCCQTSIPEGAMGYILNVGSLNNDTLPGGKEFGGQSCGYGFIVDEQAYNFSSLDFVNLKNRSSVPLVLDWAIGNKTCKDAKKNKESYACKANHSYCYNSTSSPGYRCNCSEGYQGNPYFSDGPESCQDIDECMGLRKPCNANATCTNTDGNYTCTCPKGYEGDGRKDGTDCRPIVLGQSNNKIISIALGVSISLLVLLVGTSWVYWGLKKRKLVKLKEQWFKQNGGLMLQQRLHNCTGSMDTAKIYSVEELKKATDNYDKSKILGQGGYGTVYKGVLPNNKVVAIKKSKISDQSQIEQFINEVIVLTQINHQNVVKLLGCCLETEIPLLVYEFISNGTLYDYIHDTSRSFLLSWDKRLKIATETAGALAYLHCEASMPIIHRDVKTANILLDDNHTAKVSDFGASRLIPLDQAHLTTLVQGTHGYLDPEYYRTSHLTEKSDVYSFGVVLAELLTGKKVICFLRPESERNLATYFVSMVEQDRLLEILDDHIYDGSNAEELKKVADVVKRSLSVKGDDRPTMKEVAVELDGLRIKER
ncbi:wall-associated receptor kinase 2-like [Carya illinoinensis]|uniref:Wall-associated receptor kinase 2-like n=1 Tax=Carya illinoinensis TaxID=32201 RepID=A0A8T1NAR6_CARIL|nr:wall-associated receptor kinase 2-like [Carya illinoinensis]XP_042963795.1 wall-associated receptor kinase 2-like [Carya illinoinensis]KAG6626160.1 hypothetical protein CIPAW_15G028700 [Carya illinoinensis]KAG6626161.1 hypothetical protein CIPAW_15G028700 [Carya illinoinensis]